MRHPSLISLSHDHHHGLALALRCRKQALGQLKPMGAAGLRERAKELLEFYRANLLAHFRAEEEVLFPPLRNAVPNSASMLDALVREHEQLRQAMPQLETGAGLAKLIFDLGDLLERHIRREERELFPFFEAHIDPTQAELIGAQIKAILNEAATKR
ncbi:MAG TPA: hemerythrin domain-containing protein [Acidobacteriota bacterium]|nr:hemerythrin domain-containing protein [Acidobacteriota bacterium]